jgi:hypothetical protein
MAEMKIVRPDLTPEEKIIIDYTVKLWNLYLTMPKHKEEEHTDLMNAVHTIQRLVMARFARRQLPDIFPIQRIKK